MRKRTLLNIVLVPLLIAILLAIFVPAIDKVTGVNYSFLPTTIIITDYS